MACYHPLTAWKSKKVNPSGKRSLVFAQANADQPDNPIEIACGQCSGCRLERSRQWAMRCLHESQLYDENCFITLTFDNEHLNKRENPWSVDVRDFQKFMKRLRKKYGKGIRFFHCGEYGEICKHCRQSEKYCKCDGSWVDKKRLGRPHYHALLFNHSFDDRELHRVDQLGHHHYVSKSLAELWPFGIHDIGDVTFESAAYCARYVMKKINGDQADSHYMSVDTETGEYENLKPEYISMSRKPGIGKKWFDQFKGDVYPKDYITLNGKKMRTPKYYDRELEKADPFQFDDMKELRTERAKKWFDENTPDRLRAREKVHQAKIKKLARNKI